MRTRWTPERIAELRAVAHLGGHEAAARLGATYPATRFAAQRHGISLRRVRMSPDDKLRARGVALLPAMKARLRKDILRLRKDIERGASQQYFPCADASGADSSRISSHAMKINIAPNLDQIKFYAKSALHVWDVLPPDIARENVIADMKALLRYLDACDSGNGVVVVGIGQIERGIRLEVSRRDGQIVDLTDRYAGDWDIAWEDILRDQAS